MFIVCLLDLILIRREKIQKYLDAFILKHRGMVLQLGVDVWGQKTGNVRPHAMLKYKCTIQINMAISNIQY